MTPALVQAGDTELYLYSMGKIACFGPLVIMANKYDNGKAL